MKCLKRTGPCHENLGVAAVLMIAISAVSAQTIAPATVPAPVAPKTMPAVFSIRGTIAADAGLDLHRVDLTRAVVYVDSDPVIDAMPLPDVHPVVAQKDKQFVPRFTVVPRGSAVEFPNWDHIAHNVFSRSAAAPAFDFDRYPYGVSKTRVFDKIGVVQVFCNIHPQMRCVIFVTPSVLQTRADAAGHFQLDNIPAGKHVIAVWQERCGTQRVTVDVGANTPAVAFTLSEARTEILANTPPHRGAAYGTERGLGIKQEQLDLPVVTESHPATTPCPACK